MDIFNLVGYEELYDLNLKNPVTGEKLGVVFKIRCAGSEEVSKVMRKHVDEMKRFHVSNSGLSELERSEALVTLVETQQEEIHASYIGGWDWGNNDFKGEVPEHSFEKACEVMKVNWIFNEVRASALNLSLFMNA